LLNWRWLTESLQKEHASLPESWRSGMVVKMSSWRCFFVLFLSFLGPGRTVCGEDLFSTGSMEWSVDAKGTLQTKDWPLVHALRLQLSRPKEKATEAAETPKTADKEPPALPELRYGSDRSVTLLGMDASGKSLSHMISRSLRFDPGCQAVRVLDIITSSVDHDQDLGVEYDTRWQPGIVPKLSKPRAITFSGPDKAACGVAMTASDANLPVYVCMFGQAVKGWKHSLTSYQDSLTWKFEGVLKAKQRIALVHWLTFPKNIKTETLDQLRDSFLTDGFPKDDSLSEQVIKELINHPVRVTRKTPAFDSGSVTGLPFLEQFCAELKVERSADADHLLLDGGVMMEGEFKAESVSLGGRDLSVEDIAAIQSLQGTRAVRLFLRDGSVLRGLLSWKAARFESEALGSITLNAAQPGQIVMRSADHDGRLAGKAVAWMADGRHGQVLPVMKLPEHPLSCRWLGGEMLLAWSGIHSIRALEAPALEHEVQLADGSCVRGWLEFADEALPLKECAAWAGSPADLMTLLAGQTSEPPKKAGAFVQIQGGTVIAGELGQPSLSWQTKVGELVMKTADVMELSRLPEADASGLGTAFEITTRQGARHLGHPRDAALLWKRGAEVLRLRWHLIQGIQLATKEPAPKS
jgi:hypothetical protein